MRNNKLIGIIAGAMLLSSLLFLCLPANAETCGLSSTSLSNDPNLVSNWTFNDTHADLLNTNNFTFNGGFFNTAFGVTSWSTEGSLSTPEPAFHRVYSLNGTAYDGNNYVIGGWVRFNDQNGCPSGSHCQIFEMEHQILSCYYSCSWKTARFTRLSLMNNSTLLLERGGNRSGYFTNASFTVTPDTNWHFVVINAVGQNIYLYWDGVKLGSVYDSLVDYYQQPSESTGGNESFLTIGSLNTGDYGTANSSYSDWFFFNRVLSSDEIAAIHTAGQCVGYPAPTLSNLSQYKLDGTTPVADGATTAENGIRFQGTPTSPIGEQVQLQVEIQLSNVPFTGFPTVNSTFASSGTTASIPLNGLSNNHYHWAARAVDSQGNKSNWTKFGNGEFTISDPSQSTCGLSGTSLSNDPNLVSNWTFNFIKTDLLNNNNFTSGSGLTSNSGGSYTTASGVNGWSTEGWLNSSAFHKVYPLNGTASDGNNYVISGWVRFNDTDGCPSGSHCQILEMEHQTYGCYYQCWWSTARLTRLSLTNTSTLFLERGGNQSGYFTNASFPITLDTNWHFVSINAVGQHIHLYWDGVNLGSIYDSLVDYYQQPSAQTGNNESFLTLGSPNTGEYGTANFSYSDWSLFNRALTSEEIGTLYSAGQCGTDSPPTAQPILSFLPDYPNGLTTTTFNYPEKPLFKISYTDASGGTDGQVNVVVDGVSHPMTKSLEVFTDPYYFWSPDNSFATGTHSYHFEATDGLRLVRMPESGEYGFEVVDLAAQTYRVAVILAETFDVSHIATGTTHSRCKLFPNKTYSGHSYEYYSDFLSCVSDYYYENSYGKIKFDFSIYDHSGSWYRLSNPYQTEISYKSSPSNYNKRFVDDVIPVWGLDKSLYDIVVAVHSGFSSQMLSDPNKIATVMSNQSGQSPKLIVVAEFDPVGAWAHELGHAIGGLSALTNHTPVPDLYNMGNVGPWDLMAKGSWNGAAGQRGSDPTYMSSYDRIFLGWLGEEIHPKSDYGSFWIRSLGTSEYGDSVFRYNLEDSASTSSNQYYLIEARSKVGNNWDNDLPTSATNTMVLYRVDEKNFPDYGYDSTGHMFNEQRSIVIPGNNWFGSWAENKGILDPIKQESYWDIPNMVKFTASNWREINNKNEIQVTIDPISLASLTVMTGLVINPANLLLHFSPNDILPQGISSNKWIRSIYYSPEMQSPVSSMVFYRTSLKLFLFFLFMFMVSLVCWIANRSRRINRISMIRKIDILSEILRFALWVEASYLVASIIGWYITFSGGIISGYKYFWPFSIGFNVNNNSGIIVFASLIILFAISLLGFVSIKKIKKLITNKLLPLSSEIKVTVYILITAMVFVIALMTRVQIVQNIFPPGGGVLPQDYYGADLPTLDLHLYCPDGRHIGRNYQTGEFENQIPNSIVSGPMGGAPEWIFVPATTTGCHYSVSAHNAEQFLAEHPEIAAQITTTTDSYDIYSRYIDPATGIFTSQTLANQTIEPGENIVHNVSGTSDITVDPGIVDDIPPITAINLSGTSTAPNLFRSDVVVSLSATDNLAVQKTMYSPDLGITWSTCTVSFTISGEGTHPIQYYSVDPAGNIEAVKTASFVIDKTPPLITHAAIASTTIIGSPIIFTYSATDSISGIANVNATVDENPVADNTILYNLVVGPHVFTVTATDLAGNSSTVHQNFTVMYNFSGFLQPIKTDGSGLYNLNRTLPIKFNLTDANGTATTTAVSHLEVTNVQNGIVGDTPVDLGVSTNDTGSLFRVSDYQYIYNLDTKLLSSGTWQIKAVLDDGQSYAVLVSLR